MRAKKWRQIFFIGILSLVALWLIPIIFGIVGKARIVVNEMHNVQKRYDALEKRRAMLETNLATIQTTRGKDAAIRTAFGVARAGEEVIVVVPADEVVVKIVDKIESEKISLWQKIVSWF